MPARFKDLCIDAGDHQALADWWCADPEGNEFCVFAPRSP
jgi:hypothetical protein